MKFLIKLAITIVLVVVAVSTMFGAGVNAIESAVALSWWPMLKWMLWVIAVYWIMHIILHYTWKRR